MRPTTRPTMDLKTFFPYRLALLSESVSRSIAQVYGARFNLTRDEWRVLAALAETPRMRNVHLVEHTTLDKMQVSRAVARLERDGLVSREADPDDGRGTVLRLLAPGRRLYRKVVPMVQEREQFLLAGLKPAERAALDAALDKVLHSARVLRQQG